MIFVSVLRGEYKILATDYHNYAIAWQCENKKLTNTHTGKHGMKKCSDDLVPHIGSSFPVITLAAY